MDLVVESDIYEPTINEIGNYVDYLPPSSKFQNGLRCPCGSRTEHIFENRQCFATHSKTKKHQKWLTDLNANKMNYYTENIKLNETIGTQKIIIAKLQKENDDYAKLIAHLTKKIEFKEDKNVSVDLLNFD